MGKNNDALRNMHDAARAAHEKLAADQGRELEGFADFDESKIGPSQFKKGMSAAEWEENAKKGEAWVGKAQGTYNDYQKQTKPRQDADRTVARLNAGIGNPGSPPPPSDHYDTGVGGFFSSILRIFGF